MSLHLATLNNNGVIALQTGRFNDAVLCFRQAMDFAKQFGQNVGNRSEGVADLPDLPVLRASLENEKMMSLTEVSPNNCFDVYQHAFLLPRQGMEALRHSLEITFVLLYNLALTYHLAGLYHRNDIFLATASQLYKRVYQAYISRTSVLCLTVTLACIGNLGHVYSHLQHHLDAQICFVLLQQLIRTNSTVSLDPTDDRFFSVLAYCSSSLAMSVAATA